MTYVLEMTREEFNEFLTEVRTELTEELAKKISYDAPVATGSLNRKIKTRHTKNQSSVRGPQYAVYVNFGTGPHDNGMPPFKAIYDWVKAVKPGLPEAEKKAFAMYVCKKIEREGIESNPFIDNILKLDLPRYANRIIHKKLSAFKQNQRQLNQDFAQQVREVT